MLDSIIKIDLERAASGVYKAITQRPAIYQRDSTQDLSPASSVIPCQSCPYPSVMSEIGKRVDSKAPTAIRPVVDFERPGDSPTRPPGRRGANGDGICQHPRADAVIAWSGGGCNPCHGRNKPLGGVRRGSQINAFAASRLSDWVFMLCPSHVVSHRTALARYGRRMDTKTHWRHDRVA